MAECQNGWHCWNSECKALAICYWQVDAVITIVSTPCANNPDIEDVVVNVTVRME